MSVFCFCDVPAVPDLCPERCSENFLMFAICLKTIYSAVCRMKSISDGQRCKISCVRKEEKAPECTCWCFMFLDTDITQCMRRHMKDLLQILAEFALYAHRVPQREGGFGFFSGE